MEQFEMYEKMDRFRYPKNWITLKMSKKMDHFKISKETNHFRYPTK